MSEVAARRCSAKKLFKKCHKIQKEIPVLESLSNTVNSLQAVWFATLLKRNPPLRFQNQPFLDPFTK